ncbi:hypothetical protein HN873_023863 [Arachis hypogaea]
MSSRGRVRRPSKERARSTINVTSESTEPCINSMDKKRTKQRKRTLKQIIDTSSNFHGSLNTGNKKQKEVNSPLNKNHSQHVETHSPPTYNQYHHQREIIFTNAVDKMTTAITSLTKILE